MNTKSRNFNIEPEFEDLFSFSDKEEKLEHRAQMISFRILSEIEKICEEKHIKMKDLANLVDTSASYITQLFKGNKQVNTAFMAKCEEAFDMLFDFSIHWQTKKNIELVKNDLTVDLQNISSRHPNVSFYCAFKGGRVDKTEQILNAMEAEQKNSRSPKKQVV